MFASKATDVLRIKKLNTLFMSYDGMTDTLGQSQVIPYLIGLSKKGYHISLISCEKQAAYQKNKALISELLQTNNIDWHPLFYTKNPPVLSTVLDIRSMKLKMEELHVQKQFKLVHCRSYITSIIGMNFCKKNKLPFVFDMRGFWADERVEGKIWNLKNPLFKLIYTYFKKKEKQFMNQAAAIVSLTHAGKREIQSWDILAKQKNKIHVIPCSADFDLFALRTAEQKIQAKKMAGLDDSNFVLTYLGSIGTWYLMDEMFAFFKVLKIQFPTAKFYFITADKKEKVLEWAANCGVNTSDVMVDFASRKQVPEKLAITDWGISFIKPSYSKKASSPTKMGEMLAMGIPLLVNSEVGDVEEILKETQAGVCIHSFSKPSIEKAVNELQLLSLPSSELIRQKSFEIYSLQKAVDKYVHIYDSILR